MENPEPTNEERAERANQAIELYQKLVGEDDPMDLAGDLLSDLMHLAHQKGWDFEKMMTTAEVNFNEEVDAEDGEEGDEEEEEEEGKE